MSQDQKHPLPGTRSSSSRTCTLADIGHWTWTLMWLQRWETISEILSNSSLGSSSINIVDENVEIYLPLHFSTLNGIKFSYLAQYWGRSMVFSIFHGVWSLQLATSGTVSAASRVKPRVRLSNWSPDKSEIPPFLSAVCIEVSEILFEERSLQLRKKLKSLNYYIVIVFTALNYFSDGFDWNCHLA